MHSFFKKIEYEYEVMTRKSISSKTILDLRKPIMRWKVQGYPAFIHAFSLGMIQTQDGWPQSEILFLGKECYWYSSWQEIDEKGHAFYKYGLKESKDDFQKNFYKKLHDVYRELRSVCAKVEKINLQKLNDQQFKSLWKRMFTIYSWKFSPVVIHPEVVAYSATRDMERELKKQKLKMNPEDVSHLTAFPKKSFLMEEEFALLKLAFSKKGMLRDHAKKFHWILNGYHGVKELSLEFFKQRLENITQKENGKELFKYFQNYSRTVRKEFNRVVRKYRLNTKIVHIAKLAQKGAFVQDQRKGEQLRAIPAISKLYREWARRKKVPLENMLYMTWPEISKIKISELAQRKRVCRLFIGPKKVKIETLNVEKILNALEKAYMGDTEEIKGTVACSGRIKGIVRVIQNQADMHRFLPGEILVTMMTSPDFIVVMNHASAIVTDDGGLTSHAAITARELKKPCIVGTKIATKILRDGDYIEVDAEKGVVKKIKKCIKF